MTILIFALLLLIGSLCSMSETALFSLASHQLKGNNPKDEVIKSLLSEPRALLVTLLLINIMVNVLVQNVASEVFEQSHSWLLQVGLPLLLTLLFSELIPKIIAMSLNMFIARRVAIWVSLALKFLRPVVSLITSIAGAVCALLFSFVKVPSPLTSRQLMAALRRSHGHEHQGGDWITRSESQLLQGLVELQEARVEDIMWSKDEIIYFDLNTPLHRLKDLFHEKECSKIPLCDGDLDHVVGIIHVRDLLLVEDWTREKLTALASPPLFVPSTASAFQLISSFERNGGDLALIVNEYGVVCGLLTAEDLLEAVVGEIRDKKSQKVLLTRLSDGGVVASGRVDLTLLEDALGTPLPKTSMNTLAGLLNELAGEIMQGGEILRRNGLEFRILTATAQRVVKVFIHPTERGDTSCGRLQPSCV